MSETRTTKNVTEGTWAAPLLAVAPSLAIGLLTDLSLPWLITAWVLWGVAAFLAVVGWVAVLRLGLRGARGWGSCTLAHAVLAFQVYVLTAA